MSTREQTAKRIAEAIFADDAKGYGALNNYYDVDSLAAVVLAVLPVDDWREAWAVQQGDNHFRTITGDLTRKRPLLLDKETAQSMAVVVGAKPVKIQWRVVE